jgi:hypothetical protein
MGKFSEHTLHPVGIKCKSLVATPKLRLRRVVDSAHFGRFYSTWRWLGTDLNPVDRGPENAFALREELR